MTQIENDHVKSNKWQWTNSYNDQNRLKGSMMIMESFTVMRYMFPQQSIGEKLSCSKLKMVV